MLIQFSRDYRGKLTRELFYAAGTEIEFDDGAAVQIVAEGAAVVVEVLEESIVEEATDEVVPMPKRKRSKK